MECFDMVKTNDQTIREDHERLQRRIAELETHLREKNDLIRHLREKGPSTVRLLALISDAVIVKKSEKIVFANDAAVRLHGAASAELMIGIDIRELLHPDNREEVLKWNVAQMKGEKLPPIEQKRLRLDGSMFWARAHASQIPWDGGPAMVVTLHDLTERIEARKALQESEKILRLIFETTGIGVLVRNFRDRSILANDTICELLGYTRRELRDIHVDDITHPADVETTKMFRSRLLSGEIDTYQVTRRFIRKDGNPIWVLNNISTVREENGDVAYFISVFQDLTQQKQIEDQLRQAQKMDSLGTLAGGVAHELNNILFPIQGMTEMTLAAVAEGSRAHKNLSVVLKSAERASELVDKILSFSHQDSAERKPVSLGDVVEEEFSLLRSTLPATINLLKAVDDRPITVLADETQMHQVLMNLASNAAHAMVGKTGELTISLSAVELRDETDCARLGLERGAYAKLSVRDTGHGMDDVTQSRIFDPFFTTKEVGEGTGMGLAMIHGIVTAHGGVIDVTSEPNTGTTFDIYLPRTQDVDPVLAASA